MKVCVILCLHGSLCSSVFEHVCMKLCMFSLLFIFVSRYSLCKLIVIRSFPSRILAPLSIKALACYIKDTANAEFIALIIESASSVFPLVKGSK